MYPDLLLRQNIPLNRVLAVRKHSSLFFHNYNHFRALRDLAQRYDVLGTQRTAQGARRVCQGDARATLPRATPPEPPTSAAADIPDPVEAPTHPLEVLVPSALAAHDTGAHRTYDSSSVTSISMISLSTPSGVMTTTSSMRTSCPWSSTTTLTVSSTRVTPSVKTSVTGSPS